MDKKEKAELMRSRRKITVTVVGETPFLMSPRAYSGDFGCMRRGVNGGLVIAPSGSMIAKERDLNRPTKDELKNFHPDGGYSLSVFGIKRAILAATHHVALDDLLRRLA